MGHAHIYLSFIMCKEGTCPVYVLSKMLTDSKHEIIFMFKIFWTMMDKTELNRVLYHRTSRTFNLPTGIAIPNSDVDTAFLTFIRLQNQFSETLTTFRKADLALSENEQQ